MNKLTQKERLFCRYYQLTGNYREAAAKAGFSRPEKTGIKLLASRKISEELKESRPKSPMADEVIQGFRRLAFGSIADAISLLFADSPPAETDSLDLFCISEIKRPKGGGLEIKFFDRLKALERLAEFSEGLAASSAEPFYKALERSAEGLFPADREDEDGI